MKIPIRTTVFALALLLVAPAASAGWKTYSSFEPDTPQDATGTYMHLDPDTTVNGRQVYFNAIVAYEELSFNQNVGALESRVMVEGYQWPYAILGVWKDCNDDGYIGYGAGALIEYSSLLLESTAICPPQPGVDGHNDGEWVYEFLPIGPADNVRTPRDPLPRLINDTGAFIWGDTGLPGAQYTGGCFLNPPTGTFSSSGAFLGWADCMTGYTAYETVALVDPDGSQNLKWDNYREPHCDDSTLTSIKLGIWGDVAQCPDNDPGTLEQGGSPAFAAFDCDATPALVVSDPTGLVPQTIADPTGSSLSAVFGADNEIQVKNDDGSIRRVYAPSVPSVDAEGSYYEAANNTYWATADNCEPEGGAAYADAEFEVANEMSVKRQTVFAFQLRYDRFHSLTPAAMDDVVDPDTPRWGGVYPVRTANAGFFVSLGSFPVWRPNVISYNTVIINDATLEPQGATYYTFYARVSNATVTGGVPHTGAEYGAEWCADISTDPAFNGGFDCNAENWWRKDKGASPMPTEQWTNRPIGQVPGSIYQLRDIDCYDGTIVDPVRVGLGDISEEGLCPSPTSS